MYPTIDWYMTIPVLFKMLCQHKYIEENIGTEFMNLGLTENFMNLTLKSKEAKAKINK